MNLVPIAISIIALAVSIVSLIIAFYNSHIDRRIQVEQIRGEMVNRLTIRGVELIAAIEKIEIEQTDEAVEILQTLLRVVQEMTDMRRRLKELPVIPPVLGSAVIPDLYRIRSEIEDMDPIFEALSKAIANKDLKEIRLGANGLLERICGSDVLKPNSDVKE